MNAISNRSLIEIDHDHLIHPVMSFRGHEKAGVRILESGKGMWLTDVRSEEHTSELQSH